MSLKTSANSCRVCLSDELMSTKTFKSLFVKHKGLLISAKICLIADVKIQEGDGLPSKICSKCLAYLGAAYNFKTTCEKSNKLLHAPFNEDKQKPSITSISINEKIPEEIVEKEEPEVYSIDSEDNREDFTYSYDNYTYIKQEQELENDPYKSEPDTSAVKEEVLQDGYKEESDQLITKPAIENQEKSEIEDVKIKQKPKNEVITYDDVKKSRAIDLQLKCHDCGGSFKSKCKLAVHWKRNHWLNKLICSFCKRKFKSNIAFKRHKNKQSKACFVASQTKVEGEGKTRVYYCRKCPYLSSRVCDMYNHMNHHVGYKPYSCEHCNKKYTQLGSLHDHQERVHNMYKAESLMTCPYCGKFVKGRLKISRHLKQHSPERFQCDICKAFLKTKTILIMHLKLHEGVKNYSCDQCAATFVSSAYLSKHKTQVHEKIKVSCDICGYETYNKYRLRKHRVKHTNTNFACSVCGSFHYSTEMLEQHQKRHFSAREHECSLCKKKFLKHKTLYEHVRLIHKSSKSLNNKPQVKKKIVIEKIKISVPGKI